MILNGRLFNPGNLRTRIELVSLQQSQDAGGFPQKAASSSVFVWAQWINLHGQEAVRAAVEGLEISATVRIRYLAGLNNSWRVVKDTQSFEIVSDVDDIGERHEYMEFIVRRMAAA